MNAAMKNKDVGVIAAFAACETCGMTFESYRNAQALAAQHAQRYGHTVRGEATIRFTYTGGGQTAASKETL